MRILLLLALGCGEAERGPGPPTAVPTAVPQEPAASPAAPALRRLTAPQYSAAVQGLLGPAGAASVRLEPDAEEQGFASVGASVVAVSAIGVERYEDAATLLADRALLEGLTLTCSPADASDRGCAEESIGTLARRAYRRPVDAATIAALTDLWQATAEDAGVDAGWHDLLTLLLQSPYFLYRVELGADGALTDHEWLTRTSFLLFAAPPDDTMLDEADAGSLSDAAGRAALVDAMIDDPRLEEGVRAFVTEWWHLDALDALDKDPLAFSHAHPELGPAAREETLAVVAGLALGDRDFRELLTTQQTVLDARLAALYGIPAPSLEGVGAATLPSDRPGILGHVSFLALHAHATRTSATSRGLFVRSTLLCQSVPDPPADVDTSIPEADTTSPTLRDRLTTHVESPVCAGCHQLTDPIGLAFETFDGIGRVRSTENGATIDPSGELDGVAFSDAMGLAQALRDEPTLLPCWSQSMWSYASGRVDPPIDTTDWLAEVWATQGHSLRPMLRALVLSDAFAAVEGP
jgi:hypothetical protein